MAHSEVSPETSLKSLDHSAALGSAAVWITEPQPRPVLFRQQTCNTENPVNVTPLTIRMLKFMRIVKSVHREPPHLVRGRRSGGRPRRPLLVGGGQCGTRWDGVQRRVLPRLLLLLLLEKVGECTVDISYSVRVYPGKN